MTSESGSNSDPTDIESLLPQLKLRAHRRIGPQLRAIVGPSSLLGDVLLDFSRHHQRLSGFPRRRLIAWLHTTMDGRVLRYLRTLRRRNGATTVSIGGSQGIDVVDPTTTQECEVVRKDLCQYTEGLMDQLPERDQILLRGHLKEGLSHAELGTRLNLSADTTQVAYFRALKRLIALMESSQ